jgi:phosphoglucosamine mutase
VVVDSAHGATYHIARDVFHELGADVVAIGNQPDGLNINEGCGAVHPERLQAAVREHGAHYGIAFDGDGDRLVVVDGAGNTYDGDQLVYVMAAHRHRLGTLAGGVVGTQMTNLALEHALGRLGIPFARAKVGDRYVLELLLDKGWTLGGENSGHIICLDKHTTGDGIVSALQVLWAIRDSGKSLAELAGPVELYPQVLINVRVPERIDFQGEPLVRAALDAAEGDLQGHGRVLLRASGTEPLIRVMVEGQSRTQVQHWAEAIAQSVEQAATASAG